MRQDSDLAGASALKFSIPMRGNENAEVAARVVPFSGFQSP